MLSTRGRLLLGTGVGAWLLSRLLGVDELGMAAVAIGALLALAVVHTRLASTRLDARRRLSPGRVFFEGEVDVELEFHNDGRLASAPVHLRDRVPAALSEAPGFVLSPLPPGGRVSLSYRIRGHRRGRFVLGPLHLRLRDPFGVAVRRHDLTLTDELIVYPPVWRLPAGLPLGGRRAPEGEGRARPRTSGDELATVREYVRGDDLRKVHWRATAHRGELMVRQDEAPEDPRATIVLDRRAGAHRGSGPTSSFETAVAAAASVAYHLAERGFTLRLVGERDQLSARAARCEQLLEQLATVQTSPTAELPGIWRALARRSAGRGVLVAITALPDATHLRRMVTAGRDFGVRIALLLDTATFAGEPPGDHAAPTGALRAAGWRAVVVGADDRLDERWAALTAQRHRPGQRAPRSGAATGGREEGRGRASRVP